MWKQRRTAAAFIITNATVLATLLALLTPILVARADVNEMILAEVFYDHSSSDDTYEWVEICNTTNAAIDLSNYSIGYGGTDYTYGTYQLAGTIPACTCWVVGGPAADIENGNPTYNQSQDFSPDIQNSGTVGDGVALFDVPAANIISTTVPIDAVIYGPNNDSNLIDETGSANPPEVDDAPMGRSIERTNMDGDWQIQSNPDPNHITFNLCPSPVGGVTYPNNPVHLLMPWASLVVLAGLILAAGTMAIRKHTG